MGIGAMVFARAIAKHAAEWQTTGSPALQPLLPKRADAEEALFKQIERAGFVFLGLGCIALCAMFFLEDVPVGR